MKKIALTSLVIMTALFLGSSFTSHFRSNRHADGALTAEERKFAIDLYLKTKDRLLADIKGLSPAQLNFKADTSRWSVFECTEHIALSESLIWQWMQMTEKQPAAPEKKSEVKMTTDQMLAAMQDRSHKFKAPTMLEPTGKFPDMETAVRAFVGRRDSTMAYLRTTQDDLHNHYANHPAFGTIDAFQGFILLAGHCARHTAQLEEVKADPNFPKK
ncbi:MAG: DinB family protein [Bacteroidota bacterium]|nr:DinB family protein [Bacteroidota bacterium]MDP4217985.1 DinB family protein [Bacteroidota bacterium]MDP4247789.1 DinB family protein [Bacteroidota bacterium]MDP4255041.1 DinB family protein [Bacteroidota bacterium]MDP4259688.1 DinB family protein [Bacteroidota bacterium]